MNISNCSPQELTRGVPYTDNVRASVRVALAHTDTKYNAVEIYEPEREHLNHFTLGYVKHAIFVFVQHIGLSYQRSPVLAISLFRSSSLPVTMTFWGFSGSRKTYDEEF